MLSIGFEILILIGNLEEVIGMIDKLRDMVDVYKTKLHIYNH